MTFAKYFLFVILAVSLRNVRSASPEEMAGIHDAMMPFVMECSKELGIDEKDLEDMKKSGSPDGIDDCFFACIMKKIEIIDAKGKFVPEKAVEKAKQFLKQEEDIKKSENIIADCASVNDEDVNDGEAGCDRAKLLVGCMMKHKEEIKG